MLTKLKLAEGYLCSRCKKKVSVFSSGWNRLRVDDVRAHLQAREANRERFAQFHADYTAGSDGLLQVDLTHRWFLFGFGRDWEEGNPQVFDLAALTALTFIPDYENFTKDTDGDGIPDHQTTFLMWLGEIVTEKGLLRSEERRVGKECRSRWSPYH